MSVDTVVFMALYLAGQCVPKCPKAVLSADGLTGGADREQTASLIAKRKKKNLPGRPVAPA